MRMIRFVLSSGEFCWINPAQVVKVLPLGKGAVIEFLPTSPNDVRHYVTVAMEPDAVAIALERPEMRRPAIPAAPLVRLPCGSYVPADAITAILVVGGPGLWSVLVAWKDDNERSDHSSSDYATEQAAMNAADDIARAIAPWRAGGPSAIPDAGAAGSDPL